MMMTRKMENEDSLPNIDSESDERKAKEKQDEQLIFTTKRCRRKPFKINNKLEISNSVIEPEYRKQQYNTEKNNYNVLPKSENSNVKLSTEVIDIEKECVRARLVDKDRQQNAKRKKGSIDQLLSKVEAKHKSVKIRKNSSPPLHEMSHQSHQKEEAIKIKRSKSVKEDKLPSKPTITTTIQPLLSSALVKKRSRDRGKLNKRTQSTNERYSKLSSTQLQRRLVANARERSRVHALSNAFDALRCTIPSYSTEQKLSKLTILRVAINYINALQQLLTHPTSEESERNFENYVDECTVVLQTEYGRSKQKSSTQDNL